MLRPQRCDDVALDASLVARANPGSPVRLQWSRADELGWEPFSPAMLVEVVADVDDAGNLVGWRQDIYGNGHMLRPGNFAVPSLLAAAELAKPFALPIATNPPLVAGGGADRNAIPLYRTGALHVDVHRLTEMPLRTSSLRGLGAMVNVLAIESMMDELAAAAGRDAVEYRLSHLDDERAKDTIRAVVEMAGPAPETRPDGFGRGLGFARYKGTSAYCAVMAEIEASEEIRVRRLWIATDAGEVINPDGAANQIEGGACSLQLRAEGGRDVRCARHHQQYVGELPDPALRGSPMLKCGCCRGRHAADGNGRMFHRSDVAAIANAIHDALGMRAHHAIHRRTIGARHGSRALKHPDI